MEVRRNTTAFIVFIWVSGLIICLSIGLGLRFGLYGWRRHSFVPGEELIFLTGTDEGIFCETVEVQSSGYITGQNVWVRDWKTFVVPETTVQQLTIPLSDRYYDFRKYRLYTKDWLDLYICSEYGLTLYIATSVDAFNRLKMNIERGTPCPLNPDPHDPVCGKMIKTYIVGRSDICEWNFDGKADYGKWLKARYVAESPTDVFIVLSSNPLENRKKNLMEVTSVGKTFRKNQNDIISECVQQQMCLFAFDFGASQAVVMQVGTANDDPAESIEMWTYCQSRDWFFVLIFCICPIVVMSLVTFIVIRHFAPKHDLAVYV